MDLGISGKTAIVCASSKGLGLGCALALAEEGAHVVLNGRNADSLAAAQAAVEAAISAGSGSVTAVAADVTTPEGREALLAAAPNPDILINITVDVEDKSRPPKGRICPRYGDYLSRGATQGQPYNFGSSNYQPVGGGGTMCNFTEGSITIDMIGVELMRTIWTGVSNVRIDENDRNLMLARYIANDTVIMFENYPFRVHPQVAGLDQQKGSE